MPRVIDGGKNSADGKPWWALTVWVGQRFLQLGMRAHAGDRLALYVGRWADDRDIAPWQGYRRRKIWPRRVHA